ncbi:MAG: hypothetical protein ACRDJV_15250, partial [Actinomycetota bacterium]
HDDTKAYVARRQLEGKSDKEAIRCLKRHLSNVVFRQLVVDLKVFRRPLDNIEGLVKAGSPGNRTLNLRIKSLSRIVLSDSERSLRTPIYQLFLQVGKCSTS